MWTGLHSAADVLSTVSNPGESESTRSVLKMPVATGSLSVLVLPLLRPPVGLKWC